MRGLMMDTPLMITSLIRHAAQYHGDTEIVSRTVEGPIHRYGYRDAFARISKLANALTGLGIEQDDRIATLAWNGYRHFELYYAISGIGAVCHTINPRLARDQIVYIVNHARDQYIFVDLTFVPLLETVAAQFTSVKGFVVLTDREHMPDTRLANAICYEELIAGEPTVFDWPDLDETQAASLCYTSGTTGNPKGVLYSHRSTILHALATNGADVFGFTSRDSVLPVVPMFHVNAWGIPYTCPISGAKIVFPGPGYDGKSLYELFDTEKVTAAAGVPTIWMSLLEYLRETGKKLPYLERTVIGGAAVPRSMIEEFQNDYNVRVSHAWGMTEMSPVGTTGKLKGSMENLSEQEKYDYRVKQGRVIYGVEMEVVNDEGSRRPRDGKAFGELLVRGPWVASSYYNDERGTAASFTEDGWLRTGDVSTLDADGFMQIVDRSKDLIKSGGEWISSIDLENIAVSHPDVLEAAVIGIAHPKWGERPLLIVVPREAGKLSKDAMLAYLAPSVAKISVPDDVVFVDELPHTATGKVYKMGLREKYCGHILPTE
ncbi:MAG: 3-(methylthio)propionyl-CoA ligase [Gammaproteobacteria bacterium]|nr:3-(methylthio)propionyl-CoA ligase [Gammaproteobacteria bacterium]